MASRLERIRADGERLIQIAAESPTSPVPGCPGWDTTDLVKHVARAWTMLALFAETQPDWYPARDLFPPRPEPGEEIDAAWLALDRVQSSLKELEPGVEMWSWAVTHRSDFFHRRAHMETLVHRVDAEQAIDGFTSVNSDEATDGVDEFFTELAPVSGRLPSGSLHVHRTDGEGEWTGRIVDGSMQVSRDHAKGDAALRGPGSELLLAVWGRRGLDGLDVFGDLSVVHDWLGLNP